jgi:5'-nucleotidase
MILLTNDDGLHAPGLAEMARALPSRLMRRLVAPLQEQSGMSHALTMNRPLRVIEFGDDRWAVDGTPVDCVYVALHTLLAERPSMVISGINLGANLGDDVFYSGTVGAAREAALSGLPALAVSLDMTDASEQPHFETASAYAMAVITTMEATTLPPGVFLNLNVPNLPLEKVNGMVVCPLGGRHYEPVVEQRQDPRGKTYYWIGGEPVGELMGEGTDGSWIAKGYATLTPLGLEHTAQEHLDTIQQWAIPTPERS